MNRNEITKLIVGVGLGYVASSSALSQSTYEPYAITTIAGMAGEGGAEDGMGREARFNWPNALAVDNQGNLFVPDTQNNTIRKIAPQSTNWVVTTLAGKAGSPGSADGINHEAEFNAPIAVAVDGAGRLFVVDSGNDTIRQMAPVGDNWMVTTVAGIPGSAGSADGAGNEAQFYFSYGGNGGLTVDKSGNLFVADFGNHTIRKVSPAGDRWVVTTLAGRAGVLGSADGTGSNARFRGPMGVAVDSAGNLYVADLMNETIRKVAPVGTNWVVTTLAGKAGIVGSTDGNGSRARFRFPANIAVDAATNLYVVDALNNTIRKITLEGTTNWVVTTLAGKAGIVGSTDGAGIAVRFRTGYVEGPASYFGGGVAVNAPGNLFITDQFNNVIRQGLAPVQLIAAGAALGLRNGKYTFGIAGPAGHAVVVDAATDLVNWMPIETNSLTGGTVQCEDVTSDSRPHRFYRVRILP